MKRDSNGRFTSKKLTIPLPSVSLLTSAVIVLFYLFHGYMQVQGSILFLKYIIYYQKYFPIVNAPIQMINITYIKL